MQNQTVENYLNRGGKITKLKPEQVHSIHYCSQYTPRSGRSHCFLPFAARPVTVSRREDYNKDKSQKISDIYREKILSFKVLGWSNKNLADALDIAESHLVEFIRGGRDAGVWLRNKIDNFAKQHDLEIL